MHGVNGTSRPQRPVCQNNMVLHSTEWYSHGVPETYLQYCKVEYISGKPTSTAARCSFTFCICHSMWLEWYRSCDRWNFTAQEGKLHRGKWHFAAAEAGLSKNVRYFAILKFHKRYFMTVEYHQRNFSTVKSGSHCGAFQGRPSLTVSDKLIVVP